MVSANILKRNLHRTLALCALSILIYHSTTDPAQSRENPGWGNAAQVCASPRIGNDSPDLNFGGRKQTFETGFYQIGRLPNPQARFLGITNDGMDTVALIPSAQSDPAKWLVTGVGSDLYQISICHQNVPRCLILGPDDQPKLADCAREAYGTQAWWNVGIILGPGAGGWQLGSDGLGRLECLTQTEDGEQIGIRPCEPNGAPPATWHLKPISKIDATTLSELPSNLDVITYKCTSGAQVLTSYDGNADQMQVQYRDQLHILNSVISGSGAKFGGPNLAWGWWTKADEGLIFAYDANGEEGDILDQCQEVRPNAAATPASDPARRWSTQRADDHISLTDCTDCGDDIGVQIACQGPGNPALVTVNWAASETDQKLDFLTIEVDGIPFERDTETTPSGMLGYVPQFQLSREDPLIEAFKKGNTAKFTFGTITAEIGLTGSQFAFDIFDAHCPWQPAAEQTSKPALWFQEEYLDQQTNEPISALMFGVPQTDAIAFVAACHAGNSTVDLNLLIETGELNTGSPYTVQFKAGDFDQTYQGTVFASSDEYKGVRLNLFATDSIWTAIVANDPFIITPQIGPPLALSSPTAEKTIPTWQAACRG